MLLIPVVTVNDPRAISPAVGMPTSRCCKAKYLAFLALLFVASADSTSAELPADPATPWRMESKPGRQIEAVATVTVTCPGFRADKWTTLVAVAPDLPSQQNVSTMVAPEGRRDRESSAYQRPIFWVEEEARTGKERKTFQYTVTYRATLQQRKLVPSSESTEDAEVETLSRAEKELYVEPTEFYDFKTPEFQRWLKKHRLDARLGENESDVDFARRAFTAIWEDHKYNATDASNVASVVCRTGKSHCGGLASVFVAAMRANGIPARWLLGNWANSASPPDTPYHVMSEFYADGIGWVPADPSAAVAHFANDRQVMLERCFGVDDGNFLTTQVDHGLEFYSDTSGKLTMPWPFSATPIGRGDLSKWRTEFDWKVRDLSAQE